MGINTNIMLEKLKEIQESQKWLAEKISSREYDDINSFLFTKTDIERYIELEIQKNLLIELLIK